METYGTVAELRQKLNQVDTEPATSQRLTAILINASAMVRDYLRFHLADRAFDFTEGSATSTRIVTSYGGVFLSIPTHVAGSVTQVAAMTNTSPITYEAIDDTWVEETDGRIYRPGGWPIDGRYRITAIWGYGDLPSSIKEITLELAVNLWRSADKGSFTEIAGAEGQGAVRVVGALTADQRRQLDAWAGQVREVAI